MTTRQWKVLVALAASALLAGSAITGCGGSGSTHIGTTGGAAGVDGGGAGGTDGSTGGTSGTAGSDAGPCSGGEQQCNGACVNTQIDNNNCGTCGTACSGGSSCQGGQCTCPQGQALCNGSCVNTQSDPANCGGCGTACTTGQVCSNGSCTTSCATGQTDCSGACVDTNTDNANCGTCGTACAGGSSCQGGNCTCPNNGTLCGSGANAACVDTQTDANNCGGCGQQCTGGKACSGGSCGCTTGETSCSGTCVNTNTDVNNCGGCGQACTGSQVCSNGSCGTQCTGGTTNCGGSCVNTSTDKNHCGNCTTACTATNQTCVNSACACPTGQKVCGSACTNTNTDGSNCGTCGTTCSGGMTCQTGSCKCPSGQTNCSGTCINVNGSDSNNCGGCGTTCPASSTCQSGSCVCSTGLSMCSGACVDEQTDNNHCGNCTTACTGGATCTNGSCSKTAVCGDGTRDPGEQCDDGNKTNLDGCDSNCKFEQDHRITWLQMQWSTDSYCANNALGGAVVLGLAQNLVNDGGSGSNRYVSGVQDGSITILFPFLNLTDLTGQNGTTTIGTLSGAPTVAYSGGVTGANDVDWWYTADASGLDSNRVPTETINGTFSGGTINAGPGNVTVTIVLAGTPGSFRLTNAKIRGTVGSSTQPTTTTANPPGHLPSEHLDPALTSFQTIGQQSATGSAQLCGNVTALSLSQSPVPTSLTSGFTACSEGYSTNNSLLDLFVHGCHVFGLTAIQATQPDTSDPTAPVAGAGPKYTFSVSNSSHAVNGCKDKNGATVNLQTCLASAAYSSYFRFASDRVIIK